MWLQEEAEQSRHGMEQTTELVQRMCNQNLHHNIISDFKACIVLPLQRLLGSSGTGKRQPAHQSVLYLCSCTYCGLK